MTRKGAPETIFTDNVDALIVDSFLDIIDVVTRMTDMDLDTLEKLREQALAVSRRVSEQAGFAAYEQHLLNMGISPQGPGQGKLYSRR